MERFLDYFVPEKYNLALKIDKQAKTIGGKVTIWGVAKAAKIKFHAVGFSVTEVKANGKKADFEQRNGVLTLSKVPRSDLRVEVDYYGALNENMQGAYLSTYEYQGSTEVIVATQFESHYAREAFPCIDEPAAKAVFELSIAVPECSAEDTILANTPVKEVIEGAETAEVAEVAEVAEAKSATGATEKIRTAGKAEGTEEADKTGELKKAKGAKVVIGGGKTVVFEPTPRMSTYLLAFVIGKLQGRSVTNRNGVQITTYAALNHAPEAVDFANEVAARSLEFYDKEFGVPYPLPKLDQVALPDFEAGAMENWGLVTYRESMLLAPATATQAVRKSVATTVAHELAHQWFGDLVTMTWWDDLWLNESFASVMEYYAVDAIYPEFQIWDNFYTSDVLAALRRDALPGVQSVHQEVASPEEIATLFDGAIVYAKGARLMLMLIREIGWERFCAGIKTYFEKFAYGNTVGDDLWAALAPQAAFDVGAMMHAFIDRPGYPVIEARGKSARTATGAAEVGSAAKTKSGKGSAAGTDFRAVWRRELAQYEQKRFLLDGSGEKSDWPLPEVREDLSGHYVLNLTETEFAERLEQFDELSTEEKLRLLIDRDLVTKTEAAASASLLPLLEKFKRESNAAVWDIVLTIVNGLKIFFEFKSPEEKKYKRFVGELAREKLAEIGARPEVSEQAVGRAPEPMAGRAGVESNQQAEDDNTIRLRNDLLALMCYAEDREVLEELAGQYTAELAKLDPELRDEVLYAKIYCEPEVYDYYLEQYQAIAEPEIKNDLLAAMTTTRDEGAAAKALRLLGDLEVVKPQDQLYLFADLYRNPVTRERAFAWLRENWEAVAQQAGDKSIEDYPRFLASAAKTRTELDAWREFFLPKKAEPALTRAIEVGEKEIVTRLKLIESDRKGVYRELEKQGE